MKNLLKILTLFLFINISLFAESNPVLDTINNLEQAGYITAENAIKAKQEFVHTETKESSWTDYLTLVNTMKILALIAFLIATQGLIKKFIKLFTKVPMYIYLGLGLFLSLYTTFYSERIWLSQSYYLSLFAVIANVLIIFGFITVYEKFFRKIKELISLNLSEEIILSFYFMLYFGLFAIYFDSSFLGIFSVIGLATLFGFSFYTTGISTYIGYDDEDKISSGLYSSYFILLTYSLIKIFNLNIPYINSFSIGIEYVLTIMLVVTLLIQTSYFYQGEKGFEASIILFILVFVFGNIGGTIFDLTTIQVIINTGFLLFILGWMEYFIFKANGILAMFVSGFILYGLALFIENNHDYFITKLF